jgi:hypothetical protein
VDLAVATTNDTHIRVHLIVTNGLDILRDLNPFSSPPRDLATANLDFDGLADLVTALGNNLSGRVQLLLHDLTNDLTIKPSLPAGTNTAAVAIKNFNGNGTPDVAAVSENDGGLRVFLGDGAGSRPSAATRCAPACVRVPSGGRPHG